MRYLIRPGRGRFLILIIFLLALGARIIPGARTIDDAFITFRYARNILAGDGFVYNPGEQVLGTTTPLYTLLITLLGAFSGGVDAPFPQLALGFNALADALSVILLIKIGELLGSRRAGLGAALFWAMAPFSVTFAIGGLETSLVVFIMLATWAAYIQGRYTLTALLAALSLIARPDILLLILPLAFDRIFFDQKRRGKAISKKEFLAFLLPTLVWFGFAAFYFGNPLPHSLVAKSEAYHLPALSALGRLLQHYATPFMGNLTFGSPWIGIGILMYPFLFLAGVIRARASSSATWPFLVFPWLHFTVFAIANPLIFRWYLTPPLPFYVLIILMGAESLLEDILDFLKKKIIKWPERLPLTNVLLTFFVILSPALMVLQGWSWQPDHGLSNPAPEMAWYNLELLYRQVADTLMPEIADLPETPTLAAGDVGVLGYYIPTRILDTVGLISPQTSSFYPLDPDIYSEHAYAVPPELILELQPDYVVILEIYGRTGLLTNPRFFELYRLHHQIPTDIYGSEAMLIYELNQ
ncbi:MAG: hypothetical protein FVQ83_07950 [Chloroflexi bacterium]|nr:hypothetical protein [Chloroflexota bacterium]